LQANVWISEKWIRYAIAFFLCSFFVVVTLAYSFFINGLVPSIEFDGILFLLMKGTQTNFLDVNECLSATACSRITNSECINIYGSYLCRCPEGTFFVPSGGGQGEGGEKGESKAECKPITEDFCKGSLDPPCDPNASCTNAESGATCSCNAGFKGDGIFCEGTRKSSKKNCATSFKVREIIPKFNRYLVVAYIGQSRVNERRMVHKKFGSVGGS
jgi:hypothetical protein